MSALIRPLTAVIAGAVLDALAVLMPVDCAGCGSSDRSVCGTCAAALEPSLRWSGLSDGTPVVSALDYSGVARRMILAFKEQGRTDIVGALARPFSRAVVAAHLGARSGASGAPAPELVCVPTGKASYRTRGYDPVQMLLRGAVRGTLPKSVLRVIRTTASQKLLDQTQRALNQRGSLAAVCPLNGRRFIIVDDVMTTGATLAEAKRAIHHAGGQVVLAVTLAHTARFFDRNAPS